eukprot:607749-Pleurochrysis_carterae.AAC.1
MADLDEVRERRKSPFTPRARIDACFRRPLLTVLICVTTRYRTIQPLGFEVLTSCIRLDPHPCCPPLQVVAAGEAVIFGGLESRTQELRGLISSHFEQKTLEEVGRAFEAANDPGAGALNQTVADLAVLVREQAAQSVEDFKACEMWIAMKAPAISDGNNFGVDVQNYVASELKTMRHAMQAAKIKRCMRHSPAADRPTPTSFRLDP